MPNQIYQVIQNIEDLDPDVVNSLTKQCRIVLSSLEIGQDFQSNSFVKTQMPKFCGTKEPRNIANIGYRYLREGKRIGILVDKTNDQNPISFEDFLHQESIEYWLEQLSSTRYKNLKTKRRLQGTQETYAYQVWKFNNWLPTTESRIIKFRVEWTQSVLQARNEHRILVMSPLFFEGTDKFVTLEQIATYHATLMNNSSHFERLTEKKVGKPYKNWSLKQKNYHKIALFIDEARSVIPSSKLHGEAGAGKKQESIV